MDGVESKLGKIPKFPLFSFSLSKIVFKNCEIPFQVNLDEATDPWGVKVICIFSKENPTLILIARNFETIKQFDKGT